MPRLFTGLEIPEDVAFDLFLMQGGISGARWIDRESYHITLRFIGDVDRHVAGSVFDTLEDVRSGPVEVELTALDAFGGDRPRSLFAAVRANRDLAALQAEQESMMRRLGLPAETRRFTPHVTLARLKGTSPLAVADYIASRGRFPVQRFMARRFVLYSSKDSVGGGPYLVEAAYDLD